MITKDTWLAQRRFLALIIAIGLVGVVLIIDGLVTGGLRQHKLFAFLSGGILLVPCVGSILFGEGFILLTKRLLFSLGPALFLLALLEIAARTVGAETLANPQTKPDPVLGYVMVGGTAGIDEWGFRNTEVPDSVEYVFLGDSHIYGFGVPLAATVPSAFHNLTGASTYNMGIGGYGPIQYRDLAHKALSLQPRFVIVGLYLGNDILDAHLWAGLGRHADLRDPDYTYKELGSENFLQVKRNLASRSLIALERHSRLVGWVAKHIRLELRTNRYLSQIYSREPEAAICERESVSTVFSPNMRAQTMNLAVPSVADGMRITRQCLASLVRDVREAGADLVLLLLHTKEYYYYHYMQRADAGSGEMLEMVFRLEDGITKEIAGFAAKHELRLVDPLSRVVSALEDGRALFPTTSDGHPTAQGHAIIAYALKGELSAR